MAARYAGRVEAWQIWNEPNYVGWWPAGPNAAQYVPLLEAAYPAVKRGDPNALVVMGGLSLNDYDYLEQEYQAADAIDPQHPLGEYFDVMATHAYAHNNPPETVAYRSDGRMTKQSFQAYSEIRNTMLAHGDDKPQWLTEIGWAHASGPSAWVVDSDETAADYLTRAYDLLQNAPYVKVAFWYNLRDHYWASGDWWYDALGLMRKDFSPKATYWAFQAVNGPASGGSSSSTTLPCPSSSSSSPTTTMSSAAPVGTSTTLRVSLRTVTSSRRGVRRVSRRLKLRGRVRTASSGSVRLVLQRRTRTHHWRTRWKRTVRVSTTGRFSKRIRVRRLGRWRVRARYLGTSRYAPSKSRFVYFRTRPTR
jgi:hypothetical protein